jgi:hypothetical protein
MLVKDSTGHLEPGKNETTKEKKFVNQKISKWTPVRDPLPV